MTEVKLDIVTLEKEHSKIMVQIKDKMSELGNLSLLSLDNVTNKRWFETNDIIQELFASAKRIANQMQGKSVEEKPTLDSKVIVLHDKLWPDNMLYGLAITYCTWPTGWEDEPYVRFANTVLDVHTELKELKDWARSEGNEVRIEVYTNMNTTDITAKYHFCLLER